jgi:uncharacterized protein YeaO (DUF488 family)
MPAIRTKSVHETMDREYDGLRILATRYTPQGVKKTRWSVWMANLAPSEPLLKAIRADKISWKEFSDRYQKELFEPAPVDRKNMKSKNHGQKFTLRLIKELARRQPVTIMCNCDSNEKHCHRFLLKKLIESSKI